MKQRIRHLFPHHGAVIVGDEHVPRGWINPQGAFLRTKEHWTSIHSHFQRPEDRTVSREESPELIEAAQRNAHLAYSLGWISVGHAGQLNAIGHLRTFEAPLHPAVTTLRKLLEHAPHRTFQVEIQLGELLPSKGVHEDFELRECDLDILIKRGRLRHARR